MPKNPGNKKIPYPKPKGEGKKNEKKIRRGETKR